MRLSKMHLHTLREVPGEAEIPSHIWLLRGGMMKKVVSGVYTFMPIGYRTVRKIGEIVRQEMDAAGAQELHMTHLMPAELWEETGRWSAMGPELWRVKDRHDRDFLLGPTHEELITDIVRNDVSSYKKLPLNLYHIQTKFRDEARPRFGLMRAREFVMKDAYSFDRDEESFKKSYQDMYVAYEKVFDRCGLKYRIVEADNGAIGGTGSHEFSAFSDYGESDLVYCDVCGYGSTAENAAGVDAPPVDEPLLETKEVYTPNCKTIDDVAEFVGLTAEKTLKALLFQVYDEYEEDGKIKYRVKEYVAAFVRGDRQLNMIKIVNALGIAEHMIEFADEAVMGELTGAVGGFTGPVGLKNCKIIVDSEIPGLKNLLAGANKFDTHMENVNYGRDYTADLITDLKLVGEGDACPHCGAPLSKTRGIEVGQIFDLGTKYSKAMNCVYKDENMQEHLMFMGCYGIGITRTMAAVVEQYHDDEGIIWPLAVAPYHVIITIVKNSDEEQAALAEKIYTDLLSTGTEVLLDDRDERAGVKFKDADVIGIPIRITVGKRASEGIVEYKLRREQDRVEITAEEAIEKARKLIAEEGSNPSIPLRTLL
ncbi:MAG: proline--tRNA ligase [Clostridiales Family XIII bacterium]|jgi:prolyl-tRNA synthetase|nr:proline--tRNA ligase [Clostridiales Family XIII bacterium]